MTANSLVHLGGKKTVLRTNITNDTKFGEPVQCTRTHKKVFETQARN